MSDSGRANGARAIMLLLLSETPMLHGYDLQPQIEELMGSRYDVAGVYRGLRKLEDEGLVVSSWVESPLPGPPRRVYCITDAGREELEVHVEGLKRSARLIRLFLRRYADLAGADTTVARPFAASQEAAPRAGRGMRRAG